MKYIRLASDVHLDVDVRHWNGTRIHDPFERKSDDMSLLWKPARVIGDDDTTLILAGDIWFERRFLTKKYHETDLSWLAEISKQFKYVVFVLGNHDYWDVSVTLEPDKIREALQKQDLTNCHLLEQSEIVLDQVKFVGGTLWTDYNRHDPLTMLQAPQIMNDYKYMRWGSDYRKCTPTHLYEVHQNTKTFIFKHVKKDDPDQRLIVVTHMAPSFSSVDYRHRHDMLSNYYYFSDLDQRIYQEGGDIDLWVHGHMHHAKDYLLEPNCRVVCNPRGYVGYEDTGFNDTWRLDVSDLKGLVEL